MATTERSVALSAIGQIAIAVSDLKRAQSFYQEKLGMRFLFEAGTMVFFQCGTIRLMIGASKDSVANAGTILYFKVRDILRVHEVLKKNGVEFVDQPHLVARMPDHDLWMVFLKDPDGNTLGLMSEVGRNEKA
jgi:methylmalonyl-CoA/ethylmalonyl-CoA epimerase